MIQRLREAIIVYSVITTRDLQAQDIKQNSSAPGSITLSLSLDFSPLFQLAIACPSESLGCVFPVLPICLSFRGSMIVQHIYQFWLHLLCWTATLCSIQKLKNMPQEKDFSARSVSVCSGHLSVSLASDCTHAILVQMCAHMHNCTHTCLFGHLCTQNLSVHFPF